MTQRCLGGERRLKGLNKHLNVGSATLVRQLERIQQILRRTWAERRRLAAGHRAAVAAAAAAAAASAAGGSGAAANQKRGCPDIYHHTT